MVFRQRIDSAKALRLTWPGTEPGAQSRRVEFKARLGADCWVHLRSSEVAGWAVWNQGGPDQWGR